MKSESLKKMISLKICDECWLRKEPILKTEGLQSWNCMCSPQFCNRLCGFHLQMTEVCGNRLHKWKKKERMYPCFNDLFQVEGILETRLFLFFFSPPKLHLSGVGKLCIVLY